MNTQAVPIEKLTSEQTTTGSVPWYVLAMAIGATSVVIGVIWDISWHKTIGRDSFWTPAHLAIYLGGVLAGLTGGWLALRTTFRGTALEKASTVGFWGFRAPLGSWVAVWGSIAMITSAPFDDWWHNAYGLDVEILSPPHTVLALGMLAITLGALLLALAYQNRAGGTNRPQAIACAYLGGVFIALIAVLATEYRTTNGQHAATFYLVSAGLYPLFLIAFARATRLRWPATTVAGFYMLINLAMIWILPLFRAEPLLAPIFNPLTSMAVDPWPLLLIAPALAIDLLMRRLDGKSDWLQAPLLAGAFLSIFFVTQWNFSAFLLSGAGDNWFFAADRVWDYGSRLGDWTTEFWWLEQDPLTFGALGIATGIATVSARLGLGWGKWMRRIVR